MKNHEETYRTWSHDPLCEQARGKLSCGCEGRGWKFIEWKVEEES